MGNAPSVIENRTVKRGESLTLSFGVYLIKGDLVVEEGGILRIRNSKVIFAPDGGIIVNGGTLEVKNSLFTAEDRKKGWRNLLLVNPKGFISNTVFQYGRGREGEFVSRYSKAVLGEKVVHGGAIYIESGKNQFDIEDCKFHNCEADYGGAIYSYGNIKLVNCLFENCRAYGDFGSGGAVYSSLSTEIKGCFFRNCRAVWGGAVYLFDGNHISNSFFSNCHAERDGGAAFLWNENEIFRCCFTNCTAKHWGGAVKSYAFNRMEKSHFKGCAAGEEGGALDLTENTVVKECIFRQCNASEGGGISAYKRNEIEGCLFKNCEAVSGGGIKLGEGNTVSNCLFDNCGAQAESGAIFVKGDKNEIKEILKSGCYPD